MSEKKSSYEKITDHSRGLIKENATNFVREQRKKGVYFPLSFSTLDSDYSIKFHQIFDGMKTKSFDRKFSKLDTFKKLIDFYNAGGAWGLDDEELTDAIRNIKPLYFNDEDLNSKGTKFIRDFINSLVKSETVDMSGIRFLNDSEFKSCICILGFYKSEPWVFRLDDFTKEFGIEIEEAF